MRICGGEGGDVVELAAYDIYLYLRKICELFCCCCCRWVSNVVGMIDELVPHGEELPEASRAKIVAFVKRLSLTMVDQLQEISLRSLEIYRSIWEDYYWSRIEEEIPEGLKRKVAHVKNLGLEEQEAAAAATTPIPKDNDSNVPKTPFFVIKLMMLDDHFEYVPTLNDVTETVIEVIDLMLDHMQDVDKLESRLEDLFHVLGTEKMTALSKDHKKVIAAKIAIKVHTLTSSSHFENFQLVGPFHFG